MVDFIRKILFVFIVFVMCSVVKAEQFKAGEYISGEYIKMVGNNTSKYLTIQIIRDSNNKFVYCIEPFVLVDESYKDYVTYQSDLSGYKDLTEEQKRKISLLAYYGYGYGDRMTDKWYAITQMLIWKTVDPDSEFYFTDKLNGEKIDKYDGSISQLLSDVTSHDKVPTFIKDYTVGYKDDLVITDYNYKYAIDSSYDYDYISSNSTLKVKEVVEDGYFKFQRDNSNYLWDVVIYDSKNSQDIIRPGRVINKLYTINVSVNSGEIILDIRKEDSEIHSNSDFTNTCYEISKGDLLIESVCTGSDNLVYKTERLPYGDYSIKQISVGKGYEVDTDVYNVTIDGSGDTTLILDNKLIKNRIELVKYYCINDNCLYEENALFNIYDKDILVGSITTDSNGYGYLDVGIGEYTIIQEYGLDNYTFVEEYVEVISDSSSRHYKELYNYYIEENVGGFGTLIPDDTSNNSNDNVMLLPPQTGTKLADLLKMVYNVFMVVICSCKIKRICYNN